MSNRFEVRLAAVGGQGVILAGDLLAHAAYEEGKFTVQSPTYTAQVRGGPTKIDVIIDTEKILYPRTTAIDFFLSLAQQSFTAFAVGLKPDCTILVDPNLVRDWKGYANVYKIPIIELTQTQLGRMVYTSVVALGAMVELTGVVKHDTIRKVVEANAPAGTEKQNLKALDIGFAAAAAAKSEGTR
ncbi:MAG: 2-oxoacid:acceptor oxidoreductase family protein [bacterium]